MNTGKLKRFIFGKLESELSEKLTYHGVNHSKYVLLSCEKYIKRMHIPSEEAYLLRTAAIMHDIGYIWTFDNHEAESINYARKILPGWNYTDSEIERIAAMIAATRIPQKPANVLEQIIADSDLDYLGTGSYYKIGNKLYQELLAFNKIANEKEWDRLQVKFLQNHQYHTPFAKKNREPVKQKYLNEIMAKWGW
jgi:predicted metal-dependent HD superfamily phosphohydrolase